MVLYHVTSRCWLEAMENGFDPPWNPAAQYGPGFYTFLNLCDAEKWEEVRQGLFAPPTAIATVEVSSDEWDGLRRREVEPWHDWPIPASWLTEYDVLMGPWAATGSTLAMADADQVKFNPHMYARLSTMLVFHRRGGS